MNRENVMREALSDLEAQRANNIETERQRREEARAKSAEIAALLDERQKLFFSGMRGAFASPEKAKQISKDMQKKMEKINAKPACGARQKWFFGELFAARRTAARSARTRAMSANRCTSPAPASSAPVLNRLYRQRRLAGA